MATKKNSKTSQNVVLSQVDNSSNKSEAEKIWEEVKNLPIQMFGLPDQTVAQYCTFISVEPFNLYVSIRSSATLPSLEVAVSPNFVVELADKFVIVKRVPKSLADLKTK